MGWLFISETPAARAGEARLIGLDPDPRDEAEFRRNAFAAVRRLGELPRLMRGAVREAGRAAREAARAPAGAAADPRSRDAAWAEEFEAQEGALETGQYVLELAWEATCLAQAVYALPSPGFGLRAQKAEAKVEALLDAAARRGWLGPAARGTRVLHNYRVAAGRVRGTGVLPWWLDCDPDDPFPPAPDGD